MDLYLAEKDRRIIPRWRDFRATRATGELDSHALHGVRAVESGAFFEEKMQEWRATRSIESAADLVASAWVLGRSAEAHDAAQFLLEHAEETTPAVRSVAETMLRPPSVEAPVAPMTGGADVDAQVFRLKVKALRSELNESPRNSILWVDLARAYTMLGQNRQSMRAMDRAVKLAPDNRFVLRSAARLFVHLEEPDRADDLLRQNPATKRDPWLLAAEIAVASVASRTSPFVRAARQILARGSYRHLDTAELASAVATLDMSAGDGRKARQMFRESLIEPNDNAVAQVGWAGRKLSGLELDAHALATPRSFEARAWDGFQTGDWPVAIGNCGEWLLDEPFSSRPAELGSYLAGVAQEDYRLSEEFARRGLTANPGETILVNNLVVALANQDKLAEAEKLFAEVARPAAMRRAEATLLATEGLLRFRGGDPKGGRDRYLAAIVAANDPSLRRVRAMAALHLLREELIAGSPDFVRDIGIAERECSGVDNADVRWLWKRLSRKVQS